MQKNKRYCVYKCENVLLAVSHQTLASAWLKIALRQPRVGDYFVLGCPF